METALEYKEDSWHLVPKGEVAIIVQRERYVGGTKTQIVKLSLKPHVSLQLTFHWPKHVMWPSRTSVDGKYIPLLEKSD